MDNNRKVVIIGLDGVPFEMIAHFTDSGVMPNTAKLISEGIFKRSESTIPEISSVAWSSMITGANPAQHGIYGFTDLRENSYDMCFPNYNNLAVKPFWEEWPGKSVIINVPATYPVRETSSTHISGFVSIDINKSVYPPSLIPELSHMDYRLDVDSRKAHNSLDDFLDDVELTLKARIKAYRYLWDKTDWSTFMLVFTGTDRLMHFLYSAYEDPEHSYHDDFVSHFKQIDETIGEIAERIDDNDVLMMLSDHGFERLEKDIYINKFLIDNNMLVFGAGKEPDLQNICQGTKAFAMDPARIYLNYRDKYPAGSVERSDAEKILSELEVMFSELTVDGKKVIRSIYRTEEIFEGNLIDKAPDMVLVADHGFNLKAMMKAPTLASRGIFTGKHTQDTAFQIYRGITDCSSIPAVPKVSDIRGILQNEMGY